MLKSFQSSPPGHAEHNSMHILITENSKTGVLISAQLIDSVIVCSPHRFSVSCQ